MDDESSHALKQRMADLSNEELLRIVGPDSADYRKEALALAKSELARRGVPMQISPETLYQQGSAPEGSSPEASDNLCPACEGRMRPGLLFADRELTMIFTDTDEERFVEVWACTECGQVQLVVDFDTDVEG